jgi:hypothetical protein
VCGLGVGGVSGVVHGGDEAALAVDVVLDSPGGAIGLLEAVLALGLVAVAALRVLLDVVSVVVVHAVLVLVLGVLQNITKKAGVNKMSLLKKGKIGMNDC